MSIKSELKKAGIQVITEVDEVIINLILKSTARRILETFPELELNEKDLYNKLSDIKMYKAHILENMAEASYFYKNSSIYFNEYIENEDLEEFAIHECIHHLQEIKNESGKLLKMGLCNYTPHPTGLALNEAAVQYLASHVIGIEPDFEKYYGITLYTPSPSYYALECALLNEILYFTGVDVLTKSTLFSTDDFKNTIISLTSEKVFKSIQTLFDKILYLENEIIKINNKIDSLEDGSDKFDKLSIKLDKAKQKIASTFIKTQNTIISSFFDEEFNRLENLEQLENYRRKLNKFSNIIGKTQNYDYFDNYHTETMNKLEHKCNIFENGGIETAPTITFQSKFFSIFKKLFKLFSKETQKNIN